MPEIRMPNGDVVAFPDDMPKEQIKSLIATKFPQETAPAPKNEPFNYTFLPIAVDERGRLSPGIPKIASDLWESGAQAVSAPYRAYTGELQMTDESGRTSPEAIEEGFNMATWATPNSRAILPKSEKVIAAPAMTEGQTVAKAAQDLGVTLPRAVTSDSMIANQLGKTVANVPVIGNPLRKASNQAIKELDDAAKGTQDVLGSGDRVLAGDRIRTGLRDFSASMDKKIEDMETALSATMQPDKISPLTNTRQLASQIQKERHQNANTGRSKALSEVEEALSREGMTFEGLRGLRTKIRNLRDVNPDALTTSDFEKAELSRLYGALTEDLKLAAQNAGGKKALDEFNSVVAAEASIAKDREALQRVLGRNMSDEAVSDKLFRMAGDKSTANINDLLKVKNAVSDEAWDELGSSVMARMGRDAEGRFTPDRFVTSWGHLSDSGKSLLFDGPTRKSLDDIAAVSSRFKKLNEYGNPSGTGQTLLTGILGSAAYMDPITVISGAIPGYVTAKVLASPKNAKAVADYAKAYELAAKAPGQTAQNHLAAKSRALALIAANGNEQQASALAARMATVHQTAANEGDNESIRYPESKPEPDRVTDEFNRAYLEGGAF